MKRKKGLRTALVTVGGWWSGAPARRWIVADVAEGLAVARLRRGQYCLMQACSGRRLAAVGSLARCRELGRLLDVIPGWTQPLHKLGFDVVDTASAVDRALPDRVTGRGRRSPLTSTRSFQHELPTGDAAVFRATLLHLDERPVVGLVCETEVERDRLLCMAPECVYPMARIEDWASEVLGRELAMVEGLGASDASPRGGWRDAWLLDWEDSL